MNLTLWTTLFAVLMAGAIVVMLTILVGLVTDSATGAGRDSRAWLARFRPFLISTAEEPNRHKLWPSSTSKWPRWRRRWPSKTNSTHVF